MGVVPILGVIIVTWNCRDLALRCLAAVMGSRLPGPVEVVVVDNASVDGTPDAIAAAFPGVRLIRNAANLGFAAANNLGFAACSAPLLLLLNPDAFPDGPDTFAAMREALLQRPDHAAAGGRLVFPDGRHQVGDAGYAPTLPHIAAWAFGLHGFARGLFVSSRSRSPMIDVDWLCGACIMVRQAAIRDAGPLDAGFFMYAEDVEWGCRLRRHGWGMLYLTDLRVLHLQGGTQAGPGAAPRTGWLDSLGSLFLSLHGSRQWLPFCLLLQAGFGLRGLFYQALRPKGGKAAAMFAFARHAGRMRRSQPKGGAASPAPA
jgi:N-acetylglucosaminyl-diphospho-decaprenol L-rhamnosyltransferase